MDLVFDNELKTPEYIKYYDRYFYYCAYNNCSNPNWKFEMGQENPSMDLLDAHSIHLVFRQTLKHFGILLPEICDACGILLIEYASLVIQLSINELNLFASRDMYSDFVSIFRSYANERHKELDKTNQEKLTQVLYDNKFYQSCLHCYNYLYLDNDECELLKYIIAEAKKGY